MRRLLIILALLCGAAWAVVPTQQCNNSSGTGTTSCTLTVSAHHLVLTVGFVAGDLHTLTYTDTPGHSFNQIPLNTCYPGSFTPCNTGVALAQAMSVAFASQGGVVFYTSTGTFSGSDTFTISAGAATGVVIWVGEYSQDFIALDAGSLGSSPATSKVTTTGANDLVVSIAGDSGVVTCGTVTPASGFTSEFYRAGSCFNVADRINLPPATYTAGSTITGQAAPGYGTVAIGVAAFVSTGVRHARNIY